MSDAADPAQAVYESGASAPAELRQPELFRDPSPQADWRGRTPLRLSGA